MSFHYGQGYPTQGHNYPGHHPLQGAGTPGAPYRAGMPPGGQAGQYGGPTAPGYSPYGGSTRRGRLLAPPWLVPVLWAPGGPYGGTASHRGHYGQQPPAGNMPPGVSAEAYQWFQAVDMDHSGSISLKELKQALLNSNNQAFNDETCLMMLNMFDKTRSGRMDLFGFSALWVFLQQWRGMFQQFDATALGPSTERAAPSLSPQFAAGLVGRFSGGRGPQGGLQLDRFLQVCTQLQSMTQAFRQRDTAMTGHARLSYEDFLSSAVQRLM
ncbi:hypothetical protein COCON_G00000540 [Conger conger]|uniref:Peflin n=1 Tax=Conger conger TaxID=82655 RepID=A0A9Q1E0F4_CONCO|nr:hypothetical protein COCON_G00000540 [Conger conger]